MLASKSSITFSCPVIFAILFYLACPKHGHGTFMNPLNITFDPLPVEPFDWWTDMYLSGNMTVIPVHAEKIIDSLEEVEHAPYSTGWGSNSENGMRMHKMTDELYEKLCPTWEEIYDEVKSLGPLQVTHFKWDNGAHPIGCNYYDIKEKDLGKEPLLENEGIFFGRNADSPSWPDDIRAYINRFSYVLTTFFHDMDRMRMTSTSHSAPSASVSIQCLGEKWWLFAPPRTMGKYGSKARDAGLGAVWSRGLDEDVETYLVKTQPGTIMTFPQNWNHWVLSPAGKTYMYNIRWRPPTPLGKLYALFQRIGTERYSMWHIIKSALALLKIGYRRESQFKSEDDVHGPSCQNELSDEYLKKIVEFNEKIWSQ